MAKSKTEEEYQNTQKNSLIYLHGKKIPRWEIG
jgi:hypothetical protein